MPTAYTPKFVYRHTWLPLLLLFLYYNANLRPIPSGDSLPTVTGAMSLWLDGSFAVDRFASFLKPFAGYFRQEGGRLYGSYPRAQVVVAAPFYAPLLLVPGVRGWDPATLVAAGRVVEKIAASAIAVFCVWIFYRLALLVMEPPVAWWMAAVLGMATPMASTIAQALWSHTLALPFLLGATWCGLRSGMDGMPSARSLRLVAGAAILGGVAYMVRPTEGLFFAGMGLALLVLRRRGSHVLVFAATGFAMIALGQWINPGTQGVSNGAASWSAQVLPVGLQGVLVSPGRGLFVYTPVLLLLAPALWLIRRGISCNETLREAALLAGIFGGGMVFVVASWYGWAGGYCYGPRLLSTTVPFLLLATAPVWPWLPRKRPALYAATALVIAGMFIHYVGVYHYPRGHWDSSPVPAGTGANVARYFDWRDNPVSRSLLAGPATEPYEILGAYWRGGMPEARRVMRTRGVRIY